MMLRNKPVASSPNKAVIGWEGDGADKRLFKGVKHIGEPVPGATLGVNDEEEHLDLPEDGDDRYLLWSPS